MEKYFQMKNVKNSKNLKGKYFFNSQQPLQSDGKKYLYNADIKNMTLVMHVFYHQILLILIHYKYF